MNKVAIDNILIELNSTRNDQEEVSYYYFPRIEENERTDQSESTVEQFESTAVQFESTADHFENTGSDCGFLTSDSAIINGTTEVTYKIPTVSTIHAKPTTPNISAIPLMTTVPNVLPSIYSKPLEETAKWDNGTTLIIGDSLLYGIEESKLKNTKVRMYPGAGVEDMSYNIYPLLRKNPTNIIIHAGTNNAISDNSSYIFRKLVELKNFVLSLLPHCTVIFSGLIDRYDVGKAQLTVQ